MIFPVLEGLHELHHPFRLIFVLPLDGFRQYGGEVSHNELGKDELIIVGCIIEELR